MLSPIIMKPFVISTVYVEFSVTVVMKYPLADSLWTVTVGIWCDAAAADVDKTGIAEAEEDEEVPGMCSINYCDW